MTIPEVLPGAVLATAVWLRLQALGGVYITQVLQGSSQTYGGFAAVVGMLAWLLIAAEITLMAAEVNIVLARKLWPRSLSGDLRPAEFAGRENLAAWYAHLEIESVLAERAAQFKPTTVKRAEKQLAKARTRDSMTAFSKLTRVVDGQVQIVDQSPLIVPLSQLAPGGERDQLLETLRALVRRYRDSLEPDRRVLLEQFHLTDFARKVVRVGSVGTRAWIALLVGRDGDDPLFLQLKEAEASVLEEFLGPSKFKNHGLRVVTGQRLMQATSDIFLGWLHVDSSPVDGQPRDFYGRQLKDWKGSAEIDQMDPEGMAIYGKLCGWTLARAHARTGDRIAIGSYLGNGPKFDRAILEFSTAYAEQNERDYQRLIEAVNSGRIIAQTGL